MKLWVGLGWGLSLLVGCDASGSALDGGSPRDGGDVVVCDCCGTQVSWSGSCGSGACDGYCDAVDAGADAEAPVEDAGPPPPACPASAPTEGDPCTGGMFCGYLECDGAGAVRARCVDGAFSVVAEACAPVFCRFAGECAVGQYCQHIVGGAVNSVCVTPEPGPITCGTVCGGPCVGISGGESADPPEVLICDGCPSGDCG